jgi:hypothetical protein
MTIKEYCTSKHISVKAFCAICNLGYENIIAKAEKKNPNITLKTGRKIYEGTQKHFGTGLTMDQYTNIKPESFMFSAEKRDA